MKQLRTVGFLFWLVLVGFAVGCGGGDSKEDGNDIVAQQDLVEEGDVRGEDTVVQEDVVPDSSQPDVVEDTTESEDNTIEPDQGEEDTTGALQPVPFACANSMVAQGWNEGWNVAGKNRRFLASLPTDPQVPIGFVFVFHGFGDSVNNFKNFFAPNPDADPDFPLAIIYPQSMALMPMGGGDSGIEWSVFNSSTGDENPDALLFEQMLGCLNETMEVNTNRVFAFGFSAGAVMTNMIHSRYPDLVSAVVSMSGAWFNDPFTVNGVNTMGMATLNWEELPYWETGTVLMTHGGANDTYGMMGIEIINFETAAEYAVPHLKDGGRTIIDCTHTYGHTNHPGVPTGAIVQFFMDHADGTVSPYAEDGVLPDWFDASCSLASP